MKFICFLGLHKWEYFWFGFNLDRLRVCMRCHKRQGMILKETQIEKRDREEPEGWCIAFGIRTDIESCDVCRPSLFYMECSHWDKL